MAHRRAEGGKKPWCTSLVCARFWIFLQAYSVIADNHVSASFLVLME